jgi:hypothetical protein
MQENLSGKFKAILFIEFFEDTLSIHVNMLITLCMLNDYSYCNNSNFYLIEIFDLYFMKKRLSIFYPIK